MTDSGVLPILSEYLAAPKYAGAYLAKVDLSLFVDNGHTGQPRYPVSILAPRAVQNLFWSSTKYTLTIADGHTLSPAGTKNRIDIMIKKPSLAPELNKITFAMALDGTAFISDTGAPYVTALQAGGPAIYRNPGSVHPANATFVDKDDPTRDFACRLTCRDHDDTSVLTVTPVSVGGGGAWFAFQILDTDNRRTMITTGTVTPGGPAWTYTFQREATADIVLTAGRAADQAAWDITHPSGPPLAFPAYALAFSSLEITSPDGGITFDPDADSRYPFGWSYREDLPNNEYNRGPSRPDLHFGNEDDAPGPYPPQDRWLRNQLLSMDVSIVKAVSLSVGPAQERAHFR